jgi:uncharacterized protein
MMSGERNLALLLADMNPVLDPIVYSIVTVPHEYQTTVPPLMRFREVEGDTLILSQREAEQEGLSEAGFQRITLSMHSALEAVGLTAAFSACLTDHGISANVVAGYYHDHIFVPQADANRALQALQALSQHSKV